MDLHDIAGIIAPAPSDLRLRQGVVVSVSEPYLTITIAGSTTEIAGVAHLASYSPTAGDTVWIATDGTDLWVIGELGAYSGGGGGGGSSSAGFSVYATGTTAATSSGVIVNLAGTSYTDGNWASNRYTVPVAGIYLFCGNAQITATAANYMASYLVKNGANIAFGLEVKVASAGDFILSTVTAFVSCVPGDTISLYAVAAGAGTVQLGASRTYLMGQKIA